MGNKLINFHRLNSVLIMTIYLLCLFCSFVLIVLRTVLNMLCKISISILNVVLLILHTGFYLNTSGVFCLSNFPIQKNLFVFLDKFLIPSWVDLKKYHWYLVASFVATFCLHLKLLHQHTWLHQLQHIQLNLLFGNLKH